MSDTVSFGTKYFLKEVIPLAGKLFGTSDLGELLGMKRQVINYFLKEGRFPNHTTVGRSYAVPVGDALVFAREEIEKREKAKKALDAEIEILKEAESKFVAIMAE